MGEEKDRESRERGPKTSEDYKEIGSIMGSGYSKMKKQAKQFQEQLSQMQEEMQTLEVTGSAGNGLVEITLSGEKEIKKLNIKPECVDPEDIEGLQDLIIVAFNDAAKKIEEKNPGSPLDGLGGLPFGF